MGKCVDDYNPRQKKKILASLLHCGECGLEFRSGKERESHGRERQVILSDLT